MRPTQKRQRRPARTLYDQVRSRERLWSAWRVVHEHALKSRSSSTTSEAKEFAVNLLANMDRLGRQLADHRFKFRPQKGVLISKKGGKSKRPVVIAPIETRIVQRAILDIVQGIPKFASQLATGYNYGGVPGDRFGVPKAAARVHNIIQEPGYFIRTDIKSFFRFVPRELAIRCVLDHVRDPAFKELFGQAVMIEIEDAARWGPDLQLFPIHEEGVAQGSCLSPLLCNLLLSDFDRQMNGRGVVTIQYIDDFLILAKSESSAFSAFDSACLRLGNLGLQAYDPRKSADVDKSDAGPTADGIPFLGCDIYPNNVRPSRTKCRSLLHKVRDVLNESLSYLGKPKEAVARHLTTAESLDRASKIIRGWANTMAFCTDDRLMASVDLELTKITEKYVADPEHLMARLSSLDRRRARGVFAVEDRVSSTIRDEITSTARQFTQRLLN